MAGHASVDALAGGQQDLLIDGETGWLVDLEVSQLVALIGRLQADVELCSVTGSRAADRARRHFSAQAQRKSLRQLFASL